MSTLTATVAVFPTHEDAIRAVIELQRVGFDTTQLSIVGADFHSAERIVMKAWGRTGALWGANWGSLFDAEFFVVPGFGPVLVAGRLVAAIIAGLESTIVVGGLGALGVGLVSLGVPKNSVLDYETALKAGKYLLVAHGAKADVNRAREIMEITLSASTQ